MEFLNLRLLVCVLQESNFSDDEEEEDEQEEAVAAVAAVDEASEEITPSTR